MSELDPIKPYANAESLAHHVVNTTSEIEPTVIPDEIVMAGKPAAVSLLAEGYATIAAMRARDRNSILERPDELTLTDISTDPRGVDRTRGAQLGQLIITSPLFRNASFANFDLAHRTSRVGTADNVLLEDINRSLLVSANNRAKNYAELCLAGMHGYTTRASIYSSGKGYMQGFQAIEANLAVYNSSDQQLSAGLKAARPKEGQEFETYFESVLDLSRRAIDLMTERAALIKRHESLPARLRRRLYKAVS